VKFKVFIDESGNTGDIRIKKENDNFDFNRQPYFVLAGIGVLEKIWRDSKTLYHPYDRKTVYKVPH
jgi:hypothetical protein